MDLAAAVTQLAYKPGWAFRLETGFAYGTGGSTQADHPGWQATTGTTAVTACLPAEPVRLVIAAHVPDTGTGKLILLEHRFHITDPGADADWPRWLLDRILDVERHETCEAFQIGGDRLFYPEHGSNGRLYDIIQRPARVRMPAQDPLSDWPCSPAIFPEDWTSGVPFA